MWISWSRSGWLCHDERLRNCNKPMLDLEKHDESTIFYCKEGAAASSLGSAVSCRVEGRAIDTALGPMFHPKFISLAQVVPGPIQP